MAEGLLLVAHGSRSSDGQRAMQALADEVARAVPDVEVALGYLELAQPPAGVALDALVGRGVDRVVVVPLMLHAAGHSKSDVPAVVLEGRERHSQVELLYARPFGVDHALVEEARARIVAAGAEAVPLAVLSRGTSDPDANAEAWKATRLVAEAVSAPFALAGFSGVTWPSVPVALEQLRALGATRVAAFAWFLATGVLLDRMHEDFARFSESTGVEVVDAGHFGGAEVIVPLVLDRSREALLGEVRMNCDTCAYRKPFPGLEERVGMALGVGHSHLAQKHRHSH